MKPDVRTHAINWLFAIPALFMMALVNVAPVGQALTTARGLGKVFSDGRLLSSLQNTALFAAASVAFETLLGLAMAVVLVRRFSGRGMVRAAMLVPWALPTAIMAMAWQWIYNSEYGVLGDLLYRLGLTDKPQLAFLAKPALAMAACVFADVWKTTPFMALLFMSSLASIPESLYEAADIDGAGPLKQFRLITLPLLAPTIAMAVVFRAISAFGCFDLIWVLTDGGPGGRTETVAMYVYRVVFRFGNLPYGCTLTLVMAACLMLMAGLVFLVQRRAQA